MSQFDEGIDDNIMEADKEAATPQSNVVLILQDPADTHKVPDIDSGSEIEEKPKAYECHFCGEPRNTKPAIQLHYRTQHGVCRNITTSTIVNKRYKCIECKTNEGCAHTKFIQYYQNQRRTRKMHTTCRGCSFMAHRKRDLLDHIDDRHLDYYKYTCEHCQKKFANNILYKYHLRKYHTELHKCVYCDSGEYKSKLRLLKHQKSCKDVRREFACNECPATFDTDKKLIFHKNKHNNVYRCTLCTKTFVTEYKLKSHQRFHILIENDKNQTYRNKCSICDLQLDNSKDFKAHVSKDHKSDDKHHCSICDQDFDNRVKFLNHLSKYSHRVKLNPNIKKPFECDQCDYSTTSATALESHLNRFHLKIKPFKCEKCPKSFTDGQKLKLHAKTHSKVKTHKCIYCNKYLCGPSALKKHIRRHTGELPYGCFVCGLFFISSSVMMAHQQREHNIKKIKCPKCPILFPFLVAMRMHFKRVHWKNKGEVFDVDKVEGLTEDEKDLFRDRRNIVL